MDDARPERSAATPEILHVLVQLSIALHKIATYPADHPALAATVRALTLSIDHLLSSRSTVEIAVVREQLLVEGGTTDASNPVLRALARALNGHGIGAIRLTPGVSAADIRALLTELSQDSSQRTPLAIDPEALGEWPHIELSAAETEQAGPGDVSGTSTLEELWNALVTAILGPRADANGTTAGIVSTLRQDALDESYDVAVADCMLGVGRELVRQEARASAVAARLGDIIEHAGDEALGLVLERGLDVPSRYQLLIDMSDVLRPRAIVAATRAGALAMKKSITPQHLRVLDEMVERADPPDGSPSVRADTALRAAIRHVIDDWTPDTRDPDTYHDLLRVLAASDSLDPTTGPAPLREGLRLVEIALVAEAVGPAVWRALSELVGRGRLEDVLASLRAAPESAAARQIRAHLARPDQILPLLESRPSRQAVDQLLSWTDVQATEALLDALEVTESRGTRRGIIARLLQMGDEIGPMAVQRLRRAPWYIQRDMLHLLSEMEHIPPGFQPMSWLEHEDRRVRREALKVAFRVPESRSRAIEVGLREDDSKILHLALNAAHEDCPPGIAATLIVLLENPETDPAVRVSAMRLLGRTGARKARNWLVRQVLVEGSWWQRPTLAPKTPELLIAISALRRWSSNRDVAFALALARESDDVETRFAASASASDWP